MLRFYIRGKRVTKREAALVIGSMAELNLICNELKEKATSAISKVKFANDLSIEVQSESNID